MKLLLTACEANPSPLSQLEEFIVSPFCSKEIYVKFSSKMSEFELKFKKPKKKKRKGKKDSEAKAEVGANRSVFSGLSSSVALSSSAPRSPAVNLSSHYTAAISSLATSKQI